MSVSRWNDKSIGKEEKEYDVVIVGGGISGISTAYWLSKIDPNLKIALIEKNEIGSGATGRNAGFITCGSVEHFNRMVDKHGKKEALEIWQFSEENLRLLKSEIIKDKEKNIEFKHQGSFSLSSTEHEFDELKNSAKMMEDFGINVEVLSDSDIEKRLGAVNFVGGIKYKDDASVNPIKLLDLIRSKLNIDIYENCEMFNFKDVKGDQIIKTNKYQFKSSAIVFALNGYSALTHKYFEHKIIPTRGQILTIEPVDQFMEGPCYGNSVKDYFRQLDDGSLIIGGFRQVQADVEKGYSDEITEVIQDKLQEFVQEYLPNYKDKKVTHMWSGIMGWSADSQPILGSLPENQSVFFLGGFTGHGLGLSFHSAKKLSELILEGKELPSWISANRLN